MTYFQMIMIFFRESLGGSFFLCYLCRWEWKGFARQKKRYAQNLRMETWEIFNARLIIAGGQSDFHVLGMGLCLHFLLSGFPRTSIRNWQKQSCASVVWEYQLSTGNCWRYTGKI